jgi:primosomal protein N' (replication factor Y) (superfamily II helicase)
MIVEVLIPRPVYQEYSYEVVPEYEDCVFPGSRVEVPFGRQKLLGVVSRVLDVQPQESELASKLKPIHAVLEPVSILQSGALELMKWMSSFYLVPMGEVASLFCPRYRPPIEKRFSLSGPVEDLLQEIPRRKAGMRRGLVQASLAKSDSMTRIEFQDVSGLSSGLIREALAKGWLGSKTVFPSQKKSFRQYIHDPEAFPTLTSQQEAALSGISANQGGVSYLHGVTGSGKTEVYLQLVAEVLSRGEGVIFLVPEISLTPQFRRVFMERFPSLVVVHHSGISDRERYLNWKALREGSKRIVIGARSALFSPVRNLGLILIDEEGESSYKQDTSPPYDARRVAMEMNRLNGASLVLGSATPSLTSWHRIRKGEFKVFSMPERFNRNELPSVKLVDLKNDYRQRNRSIFSTILKERLTCELEKGNQAILFVNRRGHSSFVMCRNCSTVLECKHCKISLTFHTGQELHCHYCSYRESMPTVCPSCSSQAIKCFGLGTQKVEAFFRKEFPGVKYARLDTDVTRRRGVLEHTLEQMRRKEIQVLIGTQMISKGLDFKDVTLIGILNPDSLVKMGDYSANERAFQLFVQIAGRSGRSTKPGEVVLQTYTPENEIYQKVLDYDLPGFLENELALRKSLNFPPYACLIHILSTSPVARKAEDNLQRFYKDMREALPEDSFLEMHSPQKSPIERIEGRFRYRCILKAAENDVLWKKLYDLRKKFRCTHDSRLKIMVDAENLL